MKRVWVAILMGALGLVFISMSSGWGIGATKKKPFPDIPRMSAKELQSMMGRKNFVVLDVRPLQQWENSTQKIPGAVHEDPKNVSSWVQNYPKDETVIVTY